MSNKLNRSSILTATEPSIESAKSADVKFDCDCVIVNKQGYDYMYLFTPGVGASISLSPGIFDPDLEKVVNAAVRNMIAEHREREVEANSRSFLIFNCDGFYMNGCRESSAYGDEYMHAVETAKRLSTESYQRYKKRHNMVNGKKGV